MDTKKPRHIACHISMGYQAEPSKEDKNIHIV